MSQLQIAGVSFLILAILYFLQKNYFFVKNRSVVVTDGPGWDFINFIIQERAKLNPKLSERKWCIEKSDTPFGNLMLYFRGKLHRRVDNFAGFYNNQFVIKKSDKVLLDAKNNLSDPVYFKIKNERNLLQSDIVSIVLVVRKKLRIGSLIKNYHSTRSGMNRPVHFGGSSSVMIKYQYQIFTLEYNPKTKTGKGRMRVCKNKVKIGIYPFL